MSAEIQRQKRPATWFLDGLVWCLLALLLGATAVAMQSLPWTRTLDVWVIPAVLGAGFALGAVLVLASALQRWWWVLLGVSALLGAAIVAGALLAQHGARSGDNATGDALFGAYAAALSASLPWLAFRARQVWLGVVLVWVTVAGAWSRNLSPQQVWWMLWLIVLSLVLIGVAHLRDETRIWQAFGLERLGPVLWPTARVILSISLLIAVVGLIPLGATQIGTLGQLLRHTPFAQGGGAALNTANGTPVALLGAPLSLTAPDVSGNSVILTYKVLNGPPTPPPLLGAVFDTFDGSTWKQGAGITTVAPAHPLASPPGTQTVTARITLVGVPRSATPQPLLGFDQPLSFSVQAQAQVLGSAGGDAVNLVNLAGWVSPTALAPNTTYTTTSAMLPDDVVGTGELSANLQVRMTATPDTLAPDLSALARDWAGNGTPAQQASALIDKMQSSFSLDPNAKSPTSGAVASFLQSRRGNVLLWTTAYILLGRSIGLPLRLAEGYLPGNYDAKSGQQVVRASDATVWAQMAIPGMGWLDLFPAANTLTITVPAKTIYTGKPTATPGHPPTPQPTRAPNSVQRSPAQDTGIFRGAGISLVLLAALALVLLLLLLLGVASLRWSRFGRRLGPLAQFFARVAVLARLAGVRLRASDTATQATRKVAQHIPEHAESLAAMNVVYERFRYGPLGDRGIVPNLRQQWHTLRGALYRLVLTRPWRRGHAR